MFSADRNRYAFLLTACLFLSVVVVTTQSAEAAKPKRKRVVYNRDIRPIIAKCITCHGNDKNAVMAGLRLDSFNGATAKLSSGKRAIVPGHPEQSELLKRVNLKKDSPFLMPPTASNKVLSAEEKLLLKQWIEEGAEYTSHWAFVKPVRPPLPPVKNAKWSRNEIDRFVLAKLEDRGLSPSPVADRATLIRRVTLDLTGLPPTPSEIADFLSDPAPQAYEKVVDRLLASPRYAERMTMDWLDYSRYADSNGYQADYERFQWRWRDWVLDAFNKNMPYDKFTVEQLAGDMLPNATESQKLATGFNRNHRINTEGGVVPEEWRIETVIDRVETTSTVWLGLTTGCARCHDHKYDPISQKEFYGMFSYFNNVPETGSGEERPVNHPPLMKAPLPGQAAKLRRLSNEEATVAGKVKMIALANVDRAADWKLPDPGNLASLNDGVEAKFQLTSTPKLLVGTGTPVVKGNPAFGNGRGSGAVTTDGDNFIEAGPVGNFERTDAFSYSAWINPKSANGAPFGKMNAGKDYQGWDLFLSGGRPSIHIISSWPSNAIKVNGQSMVPENQWTHVAVTYDGSSKAAGVRMYVNGVPVATENENDSLTSTVKTDVPLTIGRRTGANGFNGSIEDLALYRRVLSAEEVVSISGAHPAKPLLAIPAEKRTPEQREQLARLWSRANDPAFAKLDDQRGKLEQERISIESQIPTAMVMEEMKKPRPAYLLIRGQYDKLGAKVPATVPAALPPIPKGYPNNRLGFAKWIVSPNNPLTARVTVNRFWERFFGTGLVETVEDFGTRAEYPSHPELLDWMATEFISSGWNVKALLRKMVTSATYRQSSNVSATLLKVDPANRYLGRGPRLRLPAEVIRDQALQAAGLLVNKVGGPSVRPYQPDGIWDETNVYGNLRNYKPDMGDGRYRRSMYTIWKRTAAPPDMTLFDVSSRETCRVRRPRTNTPLQALVLMNDVTYFEAARGLAQRTFREAPASPDDRLKFMMLQAAGRRPSASELRILRASLDRRLKRYEADKKSAESLLKVGDLPITKTVPPSELAAYTLAASTILNLDEVVTKQ